MLKSFSLFVILIFLSAPSLAQNSAPPSASAEHVKIDLVSAYAGVAKQPKIEAALAVALEPDWYTYWRMPGDNGVAPTFDWSKSTNVKDVKISWPTPSRFTVADMNSFGYTKEILFPVTVTPQTVGAPVTLDLTMTAVVCHDICVPQTLHVAKIIPAGLATQTPFTNVLFKARGKLPSVQNMKTLGIDAVVLGKDSVVVSAYAKDGFASGSDVIVETPSGLLTAAPEILPDEKDKTKAIMKVKAPVGADITKELFGKAVTVVLIHNGEAVERPFAF